MNIRKYRWSKDYESAEEELQQLFVTKNIEVERLDLNADQTIAIHTHRLDKTIWCAEGSIIMHINGSRLSLQPGDTLELPAGTVHETIAGFTGCVLYQTPAAAQNPPHFR